MAKGADATKKKSGKKKDNRPSFARLKDPKQDEELRKIIESGRTADVDGVKVRMARPSDNIPGTFGMTRESIMAEQRELRRRRKEIEDAKKMSAGGKATIARGSGAARPQMFRKNG
tara:strand:- start:813 stop:1160 length:348 start_codon:yes stop_codon:yes gene_type:complete